MPLIGLPCTHCGAEIPVQEGSTLQCFACGTTNAYTESFESLNEFVFSLGIPETLEDIEERVDENILNERMIKIDGAFNEYLQESRQIETVIVSKTDEISLTQEPLALGNKIGRLACVMNTYLLPHLTNDLQKQQYQEMKTLCYIRNALLTALWMTKEAKDAHEPEKAEKWYSDAQSNFQRTGSIAQNYSTKSSMGFEDERILASAAEKFTILLNDFLRNNPAYYADELEQIEAQLKDLTDSRALQLKRQIIAFYQLGTSLMFLMEELRQHKPIDRLQLTEERIIFYTEEIKEKFAGCKLWLEDTEARLFAIQKQLIILHCGQKLPYINDIHDDFGRKHRQLEKLYNDALSRHVSATLSDFAIEISDDFDFLDIMMDNANFDAAELVERFESTKFEISVLEGTVKDFLFAFLKEAIKEDLTASHSLDIVSATSEKHAHYDKMVLRFINTFIERFTEHRNSKQLTLEDQRNLFNVSYLPKIETVIESSFTLKMQDIPLPMFMELILFTKQFEVEGDYQMLLLIENPSSITLRNVGVTFFAPATFRIKTRIIEIGKLKSQAKLKLDTNLIPTKEGRFYLMAMVNYTHTKESFWMPSLKIPVVVGNPDVHDDYLLELYKKYGVDPQAVDLIKSFETNGDKKAIEAQIDGLPEDTVEKEKLRELLKDLESFKQDDEEEEKEQE